MLAAADRLGGFDNSADKAPSPATAAVAPNLMGFDPAPLFAATFACAHGSRDGHSLAGKCLPPRWHHYRPGQTPEEAVSIAGDIWGKLRRASTAMARTPPISRKCSAALAEGHSSQRR